MGRTDGRTNASPRKKDRNPTVQFFEKVFSPERASSRSDQDRACASKRGRRVRTSLTWISTANLTKLFYIAQYHSGRLRERAITSYAPATTNIMSLMNLARTTSTAPFRYMHGTLSVFHRCCSQPHSIVIPLHSYVTGLETGRHAAMRKPHAGGATQIALRNPR